MFSQQIQDLTGILNSDVEKNAGNSFVCDWPLKINSYNKSENVVESP